MDITDKFLELFQGRRYRSNKVSFLLYKSSETVGTQYLEHSEKAEPSESFHKGPTVHAHIFLKFGQITLQHLLLKCCRIFCSGMIDKRCHVIIYRSFPSALEVYEIRLGVTYHHITGIEVPVHEGLTFLSRQPIGKSLELVLQKHFIESQARRLQEAVLEIVQVKKDHPAVKLRLRVAH